MGVAIIVMVEKEFDGCGGGGEFCCGGGMDRFNGYGGCAGRACGGDDGKIIS